MKKIFIIAILVPLLAVSCKKNTTVTTGNSYTEKIQIGASVLDVQLVTSETDMQQGLSGRRELPQNAGMLFQFNTPQSGGFWMKDMNFNLDFIWVASSTVVGFTPNVPAPVKDQRSAKDEGSRIKDNSPLLPVYYPPLPVDTVIEVNAGWTEKNNIKVGDVIKKLTN